jgi:hypothetical protein
MMSSWVSIMRWGTGGWICVPPCIIPIAVPRFCFIPITFCHPERGEGTWFLLASDVSPLHAKTKVPRVARDDKR